MTIVPSIYNATLEARRINCDAEDFVDPQGGCNALVSPPSNKFGDAIDLNGISGTYLLKESGGVTIDLSIPINIQAGDEFGLRLSFKGIGTASLDELNQFFYTQAE